MPVVGVNFKVPQPLGKIAPNPAAETVITDNVASTIGQDGVAVHTVSLQALPTNTGNVYIGKTGMNTSTLAGVLVILGPGDQCSFASFGRANEINPNEIYMKAATNGEGILGYVRFAG